MMQKLDSFLLRQFQRASDKIEEWLGISNFSLAKGCLTVMAALAFFQLCLDIKMKTVDIATYATGVTVAVIWLTLLPMLLWAERSVKSNLAFSNPLTSEFQFFRHMTTLVLMGYIMDTFIPIPHWMQRFLSFAKPRTYLQDLVSTADSCVFFLYVYFASVASRPPSQFRRQSWDRKERVVPAGVHGAE